MDRRLALPVAAICALAGAAVIWMMAPDTGPPVPAAGAAKERVANQSAPKQPRKRAVAQDPAALEGLAGVERVEQLQPLAPTKPFVMKNGPGRDDVQQPDRKGLMTAAGARRNDLGVCWTDWTGKYGSPAGRPTLTITVTDQGSGPEVTARLPHPQPKDDEVHACFDQVFSDARFATQAGDQSSINWSIPFPVRM